MEAILIMLGLLAFLGIGAAFWVVWGGPVESELRRGGALIGLSFAVLALAMALVFGLQPPERDTGSAVLGDAEARGASGPSRSAALGFAIDRR